MTDTKIAMFSKLVVSNNSISKDDARKILKGLDIKDLRKLYRRLAKEQEKELVTVFSAEKLSESYKKELKKVFLEKQIQYVEDKSLGAGIKIKTYDMIYDLSVAGRLKRLSEDLID